MVLKPLEAGHGWPQYLHWNLQQEPTTTTRTVYIISQYLVGAAVRVRVRVRVRVEDISADT